MPTPTPREAKELLIDRIVAEAQRTDTPLSETERRMLFYTETAWMPCDFVEVNEAFDRECDMAEYEAKITTLIRSYLQQARKSNPTELQTWNEAVHVLRTEDHYLLVMISAAGNARTPAILNSPWLQNPLTLGLIIGVTGILLCFVAIRIYSWLQ